MKSAPNLENKTTKRRGTVARFLACATMLLGAITLSPDASADHGPTYKRNYRRVQPGWRYRPNIWRRQRARRWVVQPRYRRIPRRPVYVPPPSRYRSPPPTYRVGPGWVWVPAPPPTRTRRPRVYVAPRRPNVYAPSPTVPVRQPPLTPRVEKGAPPLPPDMDPSLPPNGAGARPAPAQPPVAVPARPPAAKIQQPPLPAPAAGGPLKYTQTGAIAANVLRLVNAERAKVRLPPLSKSIRLGTAAWLHAKDMYKKRYFSHRSSNKHAHKFTDRIRNAGVVKHGAAGENIAMTHLSKDVARRLVKMWMDSPGHRANILHKDFRFSGLGIYGDGDYIYATQVFTAKVATPKLSAKPTKARKKKKKKPAGPYRVI